MSARNASSWWLLAAGALVLIPAMAAAQQQPAPDGFAEVTPRLEATSTQAKLTMGGRFLETRAPREGRRSAGAVEVLSWSWGMSDARAGESLTLGDLDQVTVSWAKGSPVVVREGTRLGTITLEARPLDGSDDYLRYTLHDVVVASYAPSGSGDEDRPTETVTLAFGKVTITYCEVDGKISPWSRDQLTVSH